MKSNHAAVPTGKYSEEDSFSPSPNVPHLSPQELDRLAQAFWDRVEQSRQPEHRLSRLRLWLVFLLIRHTALRLGEVLHLNLENNLDLESGLLRVSGPYARELPLPHGLSFAIRRFLVSPEAAAMRDLDRLDPGHVRRNFYARAQECGLSPELASPRALRQARALELIQNGMPLPAVQKFLGQPSLKSTGDILAYKEDDIQAITRHHLKREARLRTSARNAFSGVVSRIRRGGFLAEVQVTSFSGLELTAIITEESLDHLQIVEGKTVVATVKAPWVFLIRCDDDTFRPDARNRFAGKVSSIHRSDPVTQVVVELPEGSRVCSLITTESADALELCPGEPVIVLFKSFAVILSVV